MKTYVLQFPVANLTPEELISRNPDELLREANYESIAQRPEVHLNRTLHPSIEDERLVARMTANMPQAEREALAALVENLDLNVNQGTPIITHHHFRWDTVPFFEVDLEFQQYDFQRVRRHLQAALGNHQPPLDGEGVYVAVVDTGINPDHLKGWCDKLGIEPQIYHQEDFTEPLGANNNPPSPGHGTLMAFNVLLAAPACKLIDLRILDVQEPASTFWQPTVGYLENAESAYKYLAKEFLLDLPDDCKALVVTNSWGVRSTTVDEDRPYTKNRRHDFNRLLSYFDADFDGLSSLQVNSPIPVDIVFSAGNCGKAYPGLNIDCDGQNETDGFYGRIYGANSHPNVLTVGASLLNLNESPFLGKRIAYSALGPGHLHYRKPDICGPSHYLGPRPGVRPGTNPKQKRLMLGTSTAASSVAGVMAALRTYYDLPPRRLREFVRQTASKPMAWDFDLGYGFGNLEPAALVQALRQVYGP